MYNLVTSWTFLDSIANAAFNSLLLRSVHYRYFLVVVEARITSKPHPTLVALLPVDKDTWLLFVTVIALEVAAMIFFVVIRFIAIIAII